MQRHMSNELTMHSLPDVCLKIPYAHGESLSLSRITMVLLYAIPMASHRRQRFLWNLDTMPMESHSRSIFLMDMRRQAGSKKWPRFFGSKDLRPHPSYKLNVKDSVVHLVKFHVAVADSSTTNPTSHMLNLSLRQLAMQKAFRCCFYQSSIVN